MRENGGKKRLVAGDHFTGDCNCMDKMNLQNAVCGHKLENHFTLELMFLVIVGQLINMKCFEVRLGLGRGVLRKIHYIVS